MAVVYPSFGVSIVTVKRDVVWRFYVHSVLAPLGPSLEAIIVGSSRFRIVAMQVLTTPSRHKIGRGSQEGLEKNGSHMVGSLHMGNIEVGVYLNIEHLHRLLFGTQVLYYLRFLKLDKAMMALRLVLVLGRGHIPQVRHS